jgi:hypothetical protein
VREVADERPRAHAEAALSPNPPGASRLPVVARVEAARGCRLVAAAAASGAGVSLSSPSGGASGALTLATGDAAAGASGAVRLSTGHASDVTAGAGNVELIVGSTMGGAPAGQILLRSGDNDATAGAVLVDGVDVRQLSVRWLRARV